jgi:hypothetical protein
MEVIEVSAPELGDKLYPDLEPELAEAAAGWGVVHLVKWALARCPEHLPPSASALVPGPTAARQIARAARYRGKPEAYVAAASTLPNPVVEVCRDGIRLRGLDRYDAYWGDRHPKEWAEWKATHPEKYPPKPPTGSRPKSAGAPTGSRPSDPDTDADTDVERLPPTPLAKGGAEKRDCPCKRRPCRHEKTAVPPAPLCAACGAPAPPAVSGRPPLCYGCVGPAEAWAFEQCPRKPWEADFAGWALVRRTMLEAEAPPGPAPPVLRVVGGGGS